MVKEGLETQGSGSCAWEISSSETGMLTHDCGKGIPACWRPLDWSWGGVVTAPLLHPGVSFLPQLPAVSLAFPMEGQYLTVLLGRSIVVLSSEALSKLSAPRVCF